MVELKEYENTAEFQSYVKGFKRHIFTIYGGIGIGLSLSLVLVALVSGVISGVSSVLQGELLGLLKILGNLISIVPPILLCLGFFFGIAYFLTNSVYRVCQITVANKERPNDEGNSYCIRDISGTLLTTTGRIYKSFVIGNSYIVFMKGNYIVDEYYNMSRYSQR